MALEIGNNVTSVLYNGNPVTSIVYNGVTVWTGSGGGDTPVDYSTTRGVNGIPTGWTVQTASS